MRILATIAAFTLGSVAVSGSDWLTDGFNSQRTNWQKDEKLLSPASVKNMKLLWKLKLDNEVREMHSLLAPLVIEKVNTRSGVRQIAIATGVSDNIYAIDVQSGT